MKTATCPIQLFVNSSREFSIVDQDGKALSVPEARALWEAGKVSDCNLAFRRLATSFDFDVEKLREFYR